MSEVPHVANRTPFHHRAPGATPEPCGDAAHPGSIADELGISRAGVRSHVDWLRRRTGKRSMRTLGEWWQINRKEWVVEMAGAAGIAVESASNSNPRKPDNEHIKLGPMGGLIV